MSLLSGAIHVVGDVAAPVLKANAAVNSLFGDQAAADKSRQMADAIASPNQVFTGGAGSILDSTKGSFSPVQTAAPIAPVSNTPAPTADPAGPKTFNYNGGSYLDNGSGTQASDLAYIDDQTGQLKDFLARTGGQLSDGLTQLGYDYNKNLGDLNTNKATQDAKYDTQTQDTTHAKDTAIDRVNTNAHSLADSVRAIIGRAAGSGSSAYQITAPQAVINQASDDRANVQDTFGRNFRDLATAKQDSETQYDRAIRDLTDQNKQKESGLREGVLTTQNDTEGQLADLARQKAALLGGGYSAIRAASAPLQTSITNRQATIDNLFKQFATPYALTPVNVQTPQLTDYVPGGAKVQTGAAAPASTGQVIAPWMKQQDDTQPLF